MLFFLTISLSSVCRMDGQVLRSICDQFRSSSRSYFVKDLILEDTISLDHPRARGKYRQTDRTRNYSVTQYS